jgi:two-component system, NarL family, sensor histidine kinase UhpB
MRGKNLLTQVLVVNLLLIVAAVVAASVAGNPSFDLGSDPEAAFVLGLAVALSIVLNLIMLQRRFQPLERLVEEMERADLSRPGANLTSDGNGIAGPEEVQRLHSTFRRMLDRLEAERRHASSAALAAQEQERTRVARDLHDEVNQSLTGVLLRLEAARAKAGPELAHELAATRVLANQAMGELLTLARQLRPTALDDLGLKAALDGLVDDLDRRGPLVTSFESRGDYSDLSKDIQLVIYRVAQEALSNTAQHSNAKRVHVQLLRDSEAIELLVADDGEGFTFDQAANGLGIAGMRERALLVGGDARLESRPGRGTEVRLRVPIESKP